MRMRAGEPDPFLNFGFRSLDVLARQAVGRAASSRASNGTVILLFSNQGFVPFLRNLICSLLRLSIHCWMVIALDSATCGALHESQLADSVPLTSCVYPYAHLESSADSNNDSHAMAFTKSIASYGSLEFKRVVMQKPLWVRWLLEQGYQVLMCDLDIVWLHDALPFLQNILVRPPPSWLSLREYPPAFAPPSWPSLPRTRAMAQIPSDAGLPLSPDIVFQSEQVHGLNSGFFFAKSTKASIRFFTFWLERLERMIIDAPKTFDEQHAFNSALIRLKMNKENLTYGRLEDDQFPNGKIWWLYPMWADKRAAFIVHANWNKNMKKARLMRDGLWFLNEAGTQCATNFDPLKRGCSKLCAPVRNADAKKNLVIRWTCNQLNLQDDHRAKRFGPKGGADQNSTTYRGRFWHPAAYEALSNCLRRSSAPYAAQFHKKFFDGFAFTSDSSAGSQW